MSHMTDHTVTEAAPNVSPQMTRHQGPPQTAIPGCRISNPPEYFLSRSTQTRNPNVHNTAHATTHADRHRTYFAAMSTEHPESKTPSKLEAIRESLEFGALKNARLLLKG